VIHPTLYVECKYRKRMVVWSWFGEVNLAARAELKKPVLVLKQCGIPGELAVVRLDYLAELLKNQKEA